MRLQTARNLTSSSPVSGIEDLVSWYETSLESSFITNEYSDLSTISEWRDNTPQTPNKNNATQSNEANKPTFYENVFNSLPSVRFDGTDDFLLFDATSLVGSSYTIFIVEQRKAELNIPYTGFIGGSQETLASNLFFGYHNGTQVRFAHYGTGGTAFTVGAYTTPIPRIHVAQFNKDTLTGSLFTNNSGRWANSNSSINSALLSYSGSAIGRTTNSGLKYHNGDIGEIVIFSRALNSEERGAVVKYLGKKFGITVS